VSNGYKADGRKISRAKTITVPDTVRVRGISQYVAHAAEEFEREVKLGYSEDGDMTFEEFSLRWLDRQKKYAASTIASYRRLLSRVYPYIGSIPLNRLRPIALENMLMELRKRTHHGKPIQEATVQKYLTAVSAVLSDAKRNEIILKNPAHMIDLPEPETKTQIIPTDEDAQRFLNLLVYEPEEYKVFYALALYTGCRRGELCALKWSDFTVNGYEGTLTVSRSRSPILGRGVADGSTKNGKSRTIYLCDDMMSLVITYYYFKKHNADESGIPLSDYLFVNDDGTPIHPDTFTKHLRKLFDENGFPKGFHLHTLRHNFVSSLLHRGVDKQTVAELAGHGDTGFLERTYCHPQMALKQKAAQQMIAVLFPNAPAV
ncbi:MAG: site-specific integrase, partial [Oscillospiraceae bacterium]|nr:site-specific integrase [Oscillospiraceae bacterium]